MWKKIQIPCTAHQAQVICISSKSDTDLHPRRSSNMYVLYPVPATTYWLTSLPLMFYRKFHGPMEKNVKNYFFCSFPGCCKPYKRYSIARRHAQLVHPDVDVPIDKILYEKSNAYINHFFGPCSDAQFYSECSTSDSDDSR